MKLIKGQKIPKNSKVIYVVDNSYCIKKYYDYNKQIKLGDLVEFTYNNEINLLKVSEIQTYKWDKHMFTIRLSYPKIKEKLSL